MKRWHSMSIKALVRITLGLVLLAGLLALSGGLASNAHAATVITVSTCDETSLDTALGSALNGNTIDFSCTGTITITNTLVISQSITLDGNSQQVSIDGGGTIQVLSVNSGVNFTLNDLTISGGSTSIGAGLYNNGGSVSITNSTFSNNTAHIAGAIDNTGGGSIVITNSTFSNNTATTGGGGGIDNGNGRVVITNSTFSNNAANNNGGGGLYNLSGNVTITNSTFNSNTSTSGFGGAVYNYQGGLNITNSTFANNTASDTGGIFSQGGSGSITNSTIADNSTYGLEAPSSFSLAGNLLANNTPANCNTTGFTDNGYNLSSDTYCNLSGTGDQEGVDPKLDPNGLQSNGGNTQTIALQQGSLAIDAEASGCPSTDQRGVPRLDTGETSCDIGAYESTYAAPDTTAPTFQLPTTITMDATSQQGVYVSYTVTATDPDNPANQLSISCSPASGSQFPIGSTTVNCSASDPAGNSTTGSFSVVVQPSLSVNAASLKTTEGHTFSLVIANGTAFGTTGTLTASINWGDNSSSSGKITVTSNGLYSVTGKHTYAEEGSYTTTISVSDSGSLTAQDSGTVTVSDAPLKATKPTVNIQGLGVTLNGTFTDGDPAGTASDYTATINWGDGHTSSGTIGGSTPTFTVTGTHTYAKHRTFTVKVTISDAGGSKVTASVQITV